MEQFSEKINIDELYTRRLEVEKLKKKTFSSILNRIHKRIKIKSRQQIDEDFCFFLVPSFILGVPTYDVDSCISYLIQKLTENGFMIKYTHPNLLFISWKNWIPLPKRLEYKKRTGINIDGKGNVIKKKEEKKVKMSNALVPVKKINNFKSISSYKRGGNLIYDANLLTKIENIVKK